MGSRSRDRWLLMFIGLISLQPFIYLAIHWHCGTLILFKVPEIMIGWIVVQATFLALFFYLWRLIRRHQK